MQELVPLAGILVPIVAMFIPIVIIFTRHQQKMAEIIHSTQGQQTSGELEGIRQELRELRGLINQQTIALDDMRTKQISAPAQTDVQSRLGMPQ